jgi:hypothetical protein
MSTISKRKEASNSPNPPRCPSCGRICTPGATWAGANYCRGLALLRHIEDKPGLSGWELSQVSGMPYAEATRGLEKLRERGVVATKAEDRAEVGFRYRYWPAGDPTVRAHFVEAVREVEAMA